MHLPLLKIFQEEYRALRPRAQMPEFQVTYYHYAGLNSTIRLREGICKVRFSDILEKAPERVLRALAHILLAKLYHHSVDGRQSMRYRQWAASRKIADQTHRVRQVRGSKHLSGAQGAH